MVPYPKKVTQILDHLGLKEPQLLGKGVEGYVFDYSKTEALKIYLKNEPSYLNSVRKIHNLLADYDFPFDVPQILSAEVYQGTWFTIEKRLEGILMSTMYPRLRMNERATVLRSYLSSVFAFSRVQVHWPFGDVASSDAVFGNSWQEYLLRKLDQRVALGDRGLRRDLENHEEILADLRQKIRDLPVCESRCLVHGDYFPGNVLIGENDLQVSAVCDFGGMTVIGDHFLDVGGAIGFLEICSGFSHEDTRCLEEIISLSYGDDIYEKIRLYQTYYAFYLSDSYQYNPGTYDWCIKTLRSNKKNR